MNRPEEAALWTRHRLERVMKKAAIGALMVALVGAVAGSYCRPDLRDPGPGSALVVSQPPAQAEAGDRFWAGSRAYGDEG